MSTHTPGPWHHQYTAGKHNQAVYAEADGRDIAVIYPDPNGELEANARLIAAAPDLLALVREGAATFPHTKAERLAHIGWMDKARALLATLDGAQ